MFEYSGSVAHETSLPRLEAYTRRDVSSRYLSRLEIVEIWGEPCACIDLDTEKREGESLELYMRSVSTTSPASGQLYIYMQQRCLETS